MYIYKYIYIYIYNETPLEHTSLKQTIKNIIKL